MMSRDEIEGKRGTRRAAPVGLSPRLGAVPNWRRLIVGRRIFIPPLRSFATPRSGGLLEIFGAPSSTPSFRYRHLYSPHFPGKHHTPLHPIMAATRTGAESPDLDSKVEHAEHVEHYATVTKSAQDVLTIRYVRVSAVPL